MRENPRLARLRERHRAGATFEQSLELGEEVAGALGGGRDRDARLILDSLTPVARAVRAGDVAVENGLVNLSFLVERSQLEAFDRRLEELSHELSPPAHFKLTGPLPPYSFVESPEPVAA